MHRRRPLVRGLDAIAFSIVIIAQLGGCSKSADADAENGAIGVSSVSLAPPEPGAATVADFAGNWRATINVNGTNVPFLWIVMDGEFSTFVEGQAVPIATGVLEVRNGQWKTIPTTLPPDEGPFHFIDANTLSVTGKAGQEVIWKRDGVPGGAPPNTGGTHQPPSAPPPQPPSWVTNPHSGADAASGALQTSEAAEIGLLQDFAKLRQRADSAASKWSADAKAFRVDMWGAYSSSRFDPDGARLLYFSPKSGGNGLEVRVQNSMLKTSAYALDLAAPPQPLPPSTLSAEKALLQLWDLAPTVHADQVYLQLLTPGVEKASTVGGDNNTTSLPVASFLRNFPVPVRNDDRDAPQNTPVWRMLAERDHDVTVDQAYGTFIYCDAVTGKALSPRRPATGVQIYQRQQQWSPSPITEYVFAGHEIPIDSAAEKAGTFDALAVAQKAESINLGLRAMIRDDRSDADIQDAVGQMFTWAAKLEQVRAEDAQRGIKMLENAARRNPDDLRRQIALFKRYVDEIEKEKKQALASDAVVRIGGAQNNESQFWLEKQFEVSDGCLGTRDQTHMRLDTRSGEWLYVLNDPPGTGVRCRFYAPAMEQLKVIRAMGKNDFDLDRQVTRLNWLIGGNGPAIGDGDAINPNDALQLMCYAEYNRVRGSEKMLEAARLRLPKTWSETSERDMGAYVERTTTTYTRQPTQDELLAANRLDMIAKQQDAPTVAAVADLALKLQPLDPRIFFLFSRVEARFYDLQLADRLAIRGLMIDPSCAELHAVRVLAWQSTPDMNKASVYCAEKFAKPFTAADLTGGTQLADLDPLAGYFLTLQRLRMAPEDVGSQAIMGDVLARCSGVKINGQEIMPDALEQRQRILGVGAAMMAWILDHPDSWSKGVPKGMPATRENLIANQVNLLVLRGQDLKSLNRDADARKCFQRVLTLDPGNQAARDGLR